MAPGGISGMGWSRPAKMGLRSRMILSQFQWRRTCTAPEEESLEMLSGVRSGVVVSPSTAVISTEANVPFEKTASSRHHYYRTMMVGRSVSTIAADLVEALELAGEVTPMLRSLAEAVAGEFGRQAEELQEAIKSQQSKGSDDAKKDRKRSEPKDAFNGKNLIDWEWRLNNHMEVCFGSQGRNVMRWIREKAQAEDKITATEGKDKFEDWKEIDKELFDLLEDIPTTYITEQHQTNPSEE